MRQDVGHISSEVLRKERELVRTAKALYGKKAGGQQVSKLRKQTGEYVGLPSKRKISKTERAARKAHLKTMADLRKGYRAMSPSEKRDSLAMLKMNLELNNIPKKDIRLIIKAMT